MPITSCAPRFAPMKPSAQIQAGKDPQQVVKQMANTLTHRILHLPSTRLRQAAEEQDYEILKAADRLFEAGPETGDKEE